MTERIRDFLRRRREDGLDDGPCLVVDLDVVRDNYRGLRQGAAGQPGVLRRQGEPGAGAAVAAGLARLLLRHRLGRRDRDGARRRRRGRPHLLRQHDQEGTRHRARLRARRPAVRGRLQGRGGEDRAAPRPAPGSSAASCSTAPGRNGRCRASSAATRTWRSTCSSMRRSSASSRYGVSFHVGSQQRRTAAWDEALKSAAAIFRACAERGINLSMVNLGGGFPTKYLREVPAVQAYGRSIFKAPAQAFRQPHPGDHHRTGPRHGRQCRRDRGRSRARLEEERGGRGALGLPRHRQVRRSRRDDGRVDPLPDPHAAGRRRGRRRACSPDRPAIRPTCCTRRCLTICRSALRSATGC